MRIELIGVPSNSAGTLDGVARAPAALRRARLPEALGGHTEVVDAGDLQLPAPSPERAPSGLIAEPALVAMVASVRAATRSSRPGGSAARPAPAPIPTPT